MNLDNPNLQIEPATPGPEVISEPLPANPAPTQGKRFVSVDEPKTRQFTGRATEREFERINKALAARKQDGKPYDIVRFALDAMDHIEADIFQTFKTK